MTDREHKAQLRVCHELIDARHLDRRKMRGNTGPPGYVLANKRFCDLSAYAWCFTHELYVCDIHLNSMHNGCDTRIEFPKQTTLPGSNLFLQHDNGGNPE